ncbi:hypothetical protein MT418_003453 [Batrachochytrium dendrobatidis]
MQLSHVELSEVDCRDLTRWILEVMAAREVFKRVIPPLSTRLHKGQSGRIGVVGGSLEYTGAPYYAAMAALYTGVDLCHVFCAQDAAPAIKCYSPELVVHPSIVSKRDCEHLNPVAIDNCIETAVDRMTPLLCRLDSLVVGPGLSRDPVMLAMAKRIVEKVISLGTPLVIDADGLCLVEQTPGLVMGYQNVILTPNTNEFKRLCHSVNIDASENCEVAAVQLSKALGSVTILCKGSKDLIATGDDILFVSDPTSLRRCGGQGDVLAGILCAFLAWRNGYQSGRWTAQDQSTDISLMIVASNASSFARKCAALAFEKHKRSIVASSILKEIGPAFDTLYDDEL